VLTEKPEERDHYEDLNIGERTVSRYLLDKKCGVVWTGVIWSRIGPSGELL
jgi:hypothetical protein